MWFDVIVAPNLQQLFDQHFGDNVVVANCPDPNDASSCQDSGRTTLPAGRYRVDLLYRNSPPGAECCSGYYLASNPSSQIQLVDSTTLNNLAGATTIGMFDFSQDFGIWLRTADQETGCVSACTFTSNPQYNSDPNAATTPPADTYDHFLIFNAPGGSFVVTIEDQRGLGDHDFDDQILYFHSLNNPPTANAGGPYTVSEGGTVTLNGSGSDPDGDSLSYAWDLDNNGSFETPGQSVAFSAVGRDGPSDQPVVLQVCDNLGGCATSKTNVHIENVDPTASLGNNGPINEGSSATVSFTNQSDPSPADVNAGFHYVFACDGSPIGILSYPSAGPSASITCKFPDGPSDHTVTGQIIDKDNGYHDYSTVVHVNNVAPTVSTPVVTPEPSAEGEQVVASASFTDPAGTYDQPYTCVVDYGDGSGLQTGTVNGFTCVGPSHTYADNLPNNDPYTVTIKVTDKDSGTGSNQGPHVVDNDPPTVNLSVDPEPSNEGAPVNATITFSDPGINDAPFTCQIDWGDGTGPVAGTIDGNKCVVLSHTYVDNLPSNAPYTVTASVTDKDGGTGSAQVGHEVDNVAPQVSCPDPNPAIINENDKTSINCTIKDPGINDTFTVTINWHDGDPPESSFTLAAASTSFSTPADPNSLPGAATHQYLDDNPTGTASDAYQIDVTVTDKDHGVGDATTNVTVNNLDPTLTLTAPDQGTLYPVTSATVNLTGTFADIGTLDTHVATIDWDDGTSSQCPPNTAECTLTETGGSGSLAATHTYNGAGVYTLQVTLSDDDTGSATQTVMVVVYDPSAGFVTGGGWLNSPAGAYTADPTLTGRANFGFVSKYQKGANIPTGQTEFQFQAASLNFHSDSYQWLVVSGPKAQYRGAGTLNGVSGYTFLLTATDGDQPGGGGVDKFRIKIWNSGGVVYDNSPGSSEDIDQANPEAIEGGSIVIHSK